MAIVDGWIYMRTHTLVQLKIRTLEDGRLSNSKKTRARGKGDIRFQPFHHHHHHHRSHYYRGARIHFRVLITPPCIHWTVIYHSAAVYYGPRCRRPRRSPRLRAPPPRVRCPAERPRKYIDCD